MASLVQLVTHFVVPLLNSSDHGTVFGKQQIAGVRMIVPDTKEVGTQMCKRGFTSWFFFCAPRKISQKGGEALGCVMKMLLRSPQLLAALKGWPCNLASAVIVRLAVRIKS